MPQKRFSIGRIYLALVLVVMYLPIFYLIYYSFSSGEHMDGFHHFSWVHYQALFQDTRMISIVLNTLVLALLSALLATVVGTAGALMINGMHNRLWRRNILILNNILLVSPDVIIGASFLIFFTFLGFKLGFWSVLFSHVAFSIPIVVLMVLPRVKELPKSLKDAAYDLGATRWQAFSQVTIPGIMDGIMAGFFMALTYSLDDFAVTFFVTGNGFSTLSVEIYSRARQGIDLEINALSTIMFLVSLILVYIYYRFSTKKGAKRRLTQ